jgi:hypothetical protein
MYQEFIRCWYLIYLTILHNMQIVYSVQSEVIPLRSQTGYGRKCTLVP